MELLITMLICIVIVGLASLFVVVKLDKILRRQEILVKKNKHLFEAFENQK